MTIVWLTNVSMRKIADWRAFKASLPDSKSRIIERAQHADRLVPGSLQIRGLETTVRKVCDVPL